jgi:hypothetical protein
MACIPRFDTRPPPAARAASSFAGATAGAFWPLCRPFRPSFLGWPLWSLAKRAQLHDWSNPFNSHAARYLGEIWKTPSEWDQNKARPMSPSPKTALLGLAWLVWRHILAILVASTGGESGLEIR